MVIGPYIYYNIQKFQHSRKESGNACVDLLRRKYGGFTKKFGSSCA